MFLWFPVLDLARAPRRTARKKGSGYENEQIPFQVFRQSRTQSQRWLWVRDWCSVRLLFEGFCNLVPRLFPLRASLFLFVSVLFSWTFLICFIKLDFIIVSYSIYVSKHATSMLTTVRKFKRRNKIACVSNIYGIDIGNNWNIFDWIKNGVNCFMLLMTILWLCFKLKPSYIPVETTLNGIVIHSELAILPDKLCCVWTATRD